MLSDVQNLDEVKKSFGDVVRIEDLDRLGEISKERRALYLLEKSSLNEDMIAERLGNISGIKVLDEISFDKTLSKVLPIKLINEYQAVVIKKDETGVTLATSFCPSKEANTWVKALTGLEPEWYIAGGVKISEKIAEQFGVGADSLSEDLGDFSDEDSIESEEDENAAIIKFVNEIITRALSDRATDIHIEPQRDALIIRQRIDGNLVPVRVPDNLVRYKSAIISRIKIMARLNISEKRRPQDGRITFNSKNGEEIDVRVSSLPTMYGESISLRLLSQKSQPVSIEDLGFLPEDVKKVSGPLSRPHGIILVTGPTGSGKSTTLTAFIRRLRTPEVRIITVEDPVEYEVEGVNQTQVHSEIGLTFSSVLRSVLRQDPDIIMVGEIRDRETADIAIRASLTGHLVLSTLHTNDAAGALTRLIDMDIEPFLIASSIEMILAQRLVRRLCPSCKSIKDYEITYLESCLVSLGINPAEIANTAGICGPVGCQKCRDIGYYGRLGIFEILLTNDDIHDAIIKRKTAHEIKRIASAHGMRSLQECGWALVKKGMTGLDEIMYYAHMGE